jgi:hypothetical protein
VPAQTHEIEAFEVRRARVAERISNHLSKRRVTFWPQENPILWSLGSFEFRGFGVAVHFVPNIGNLEIFGAANDYLRRRPRMDGIAVLTNDCRDLNSLSMAQGSRIIRLADVFDIRSDGGTSLDMERLAQCALPATELRPPSRGRPAVQRERLMPIIDRLQATKEWLGLSERGQVRRIKADYLLVHGREAAIANSTVREALKRFKSG